MLEIVNTCVWPVEPEFSDIVGLIEIFEITLPVANDLVLADPMR